jgi:hypothetical protein
MSANERQVGGSHYKHDGNGEEHWDRVSRLGLDYFQGQITKYVERWKMKNGVQDLEKARHFLDKYIELHSPKNEKPIQKEGPVKTNPFMRGVVDKPYYVGTPDQLPLKGGWSIEGYFGNMTQMYKCPVCRKCVDAISFQHALEQHEGCPGSKLTA